MTKLNCRAGDLAVVVRSRSGESLGKFVRCLKIVEAGDVVAREDGGYAGFVDCDVNIGISWVVDSPVGLAVTDIGHFALCAIRDAALRPIRDTDGEDEMLRLVGLPNKEAAHG